MRLLAQLQTLDDALLAWQRYQQIPYEQVAQEFIKENTINPGEPGSPR